jgi:hypothetical protein
MPNENTLATGTETPLNDNSVTDEAKAAADKAAADKLAAEGSPEAKAAAEKAAAEKEVADKETARRAALTDEQRKSEDDAKAAAEAKQKENFGAPEKFEFKRDENRAPLKPELLTKLEAFARERNLSQKSADVLHVLGREVADAALEQVQETIEKTKADWEVQSKADKEFGGDQLDANLGVARKALEVHGTPELKALLNDSGLGNHPEVIRWMYRVGKTIKQDEHVTGTRQGESKTAQSYYPNSKMNP